MTARVSSRRKTGEKGDATIEPRTRRWPSWAGTLVALTLYVLALSLWRESLPDGLINDAAEEALRGIYLLEAGKLEVITVVIGNSAETLYLYLLGGASALLGSTIFAVQVVSWGVALACVWLGIRVTRRLDPTLPTWVTLLLITSSVWLFHYARSGLRAISAPFFLLAFCLLLERAERDPEQRGAAVGCGALLALSLYAYTSCRVLPVALTVHATVQLLRWPQRRRVLLRCYGNMLVGSLVVSLPNLLFFVQSPQAFLLRGSYVLLGGFSTMITHVLWSFLLPFYYADKYRVLSGPTHFFDGVSAGLTASGVDPLHPIVAAAFLIGLTQAWRRRGEPTMAFLLTAWLTSTLLLGTSGPSLTRFLIVLPTFLVLASVGAGAVLRRRPRLRVVMAATLLVLVASQARSYFFIFAQNAKAQQYFSPVATPLGQRARQLAARDQRVLCVVSRDANVVNYLTHDYARAVRIVEFYHRPLNVREIPVAEFQPQVLLIDRTRRFAEFRATFPAQQHIGMHPRFEEIHLTRLE